MHTKIIGKLQSKKLHTFMIFSKRRKKKLIKYWGEVGTWRKSINSCSVTSSCTEILLHKFHLKSLYSREGASTGSEKANKGNAKFTKVFRYASILLFPWISLYNSRHIRPDTSAVVVAIAGTIFPAISFDLQRGEKRI